MQTNLILSMIKLENAPQVLFIYSFRYLLQNIQYKIGLSSYSSDTLLISIVSTLIRLLNDDILLLFGLMVLNLLSITFIRNIHILTKNWKKKDVKCRKMTKFKVDRIPFYVPMSLRVVT